MLPIYCLETVNVSSSYSAFSALENDKFEYSGVWIDLHLRSLFRIKLNTFGFWIQTVLFLVDLLNFFHSFLCSYCLFGASLFENKSK